MVNAMSQPRYAQERDLVPIEQEAELGPGLVWMGVENLAPIRIQSPDLPAHSKSVYQLCYPGPVAY